MELVRAIESMGGKSRFTDSVLSKKLREISRIEGKKRATVSLADLTAATDYLAGTGKIFSVTVTSADDLLIECSETLKDISVESRQRRLRHEKSVEIFTNSDLNQKKSIVKSKKKHKTERTERTSINVYSDFYDE